MQEGISDEGRRVYSEAYDYFDKGEYSEAEQTVLKYLENRGASHGLLELLLGNISLKKGDTPSAYRHYRKSAELFGEAADIWLTAANLAYTLKKNDDAEFCLLKADALSPLEDEPLRMLAHIRLKGENYKGASDIFVRIKDKNRNDYKGLLYSYCVRGDIRNARHLLHHLSMHEGWEKWWKQYGLYMIQTDKKEAAAAFRVFLKTGNASNDDKKVIASIFADMKIYDEAYALFSLLDKREMNCRELINSSVCAYRLEKLDASAETLKISITKGCGTKPAMMLGHIYMAQKRYEEAGEAFLNIKSDHAKYMAALSYANGSENEKALALLKTISKNGKMGKKISKLEDYINAEKNK